MAKNNRSEVTTEVISKIQPTVTTTKHRDVLINDLIAGVVMEKDVVSSFSSAGSVTANYLSATQIVYTITSDITVSFSNVQNGGRYKLVINKSAANNVSFSGVTGTIEGQVIGKTVLHYDVWSVDSKIYVTQINRQDGGSISISSITDLTNITTTNVALFDYKINDNVCEFVAKLTITTSSTLSEIGFDITGRQFGTFERQTPTSYPANVIVYDNATANYTACNLDVTDNSGTYEFRIDDVVNPGSLWPVDTYVLRLNGRFFIT